MGTFTEDEYKAALDAACLANDRVAFILAKDDDERRTILRSQGKTNEARMTATLAVADELSKMKNGTDLEKATASLICVGVNLKYG